ncbi:MAG TPA: hypothetical protein ENJ18_11190 [Nannocystis exedens]|nr:hypothetical protein [Nannocystis exedens]
MNKASIMVLSWAFVTAVGCSMPGQGTSAGTSETEATTGSTSSSSATSGGTETSSAGGETSSTGGDSCGDGVIDPGELCDGDALDGMTCVGLGAPYIGGELGCAPGCDAFDASTCELEEGAAKIRLNEFLAKGALEGPFADKGDIIEIYNAGAAAADLGGWKLSDEVDFPNNKTYVFPEGSSLAPGAWLALVQFDDVSQSGDFPFGISSSKKETLLLADASGVVVDSQTFDGTLAVTSYCRIADGEDNWVLCLQTPEAENIASGEDPVVCGDGEITGEEQCDGAQLGGQTCVDVGEFEGGELACTDTCTFDTSACTSALALVLNELSASDLDPIELFNAGGAAVDLSGWVLTDDTSDPYDVDADLKKMVFAEGVTIAAGAYMVIEKGDLEGMHVFGLGGKGDTLRFFNAGLELVDSVTYGDGEAAISYCRLPDGPGGAWTVDCMATFGSANQGP